MQIPVLIEPVTSGFRAKVGEPLPVAAEGATPEEAVSNLRTAMGQQLQNGKQLLPLDLGQQNPWLAMAGIYDANDPLVQRWKEEMAAYRQEIEDDVNRP